MSPRTRPDLSQDLLPNLVSEAEPCAVPADSRLAEADTAQGDVNAATSAAAVMSGKDCERVPPPTPSHACDGSSDRDAGEAPLRPSTAPASDRGPGASAAPTRRADLWARAPRPAAVRLRRTLAVGVALAASSILAGSLAWAFVVRPEIRAGAMAHKEPQNPDERLARPPRSLSERPGRYDQLPPPRTWPTGLQDGGPDADPDATSQVSSPKVGQTSALDEGPHHRSRFQPDEGAPPLHQYTARPLPDQTPPPTLELRAHGSQLFFSAADDASPGTRRSDASTSEGRVSRAEGGQTTGAAADRGIYNPARLTRPLSPYEIKAGAIIPAALLTAVDTGRRGPAAAVVTRGIHDSVSGRHLLVPQGSRLIGRYDGDSAYGERKAFIVWERLLLPDGRSLALDDEPGVDAAGALGSQGRVDRRLLPLALAVLAGGAVTAIGEAARDSDGGGGLIGDAGDAAALEAARTGARIIDRELQVRPVIRLAPGAPVGVLVTRDLVLEPWRP